jgi:hypothetical protein
MNRSFLLLRLLVFLDRRFTLHLMCTTRTFDVYCSRGWHLSASSRRGKSVSSVWFRRLYGNVAQQQFDLLQLTPSRMAEPPARSPTMPISA